MIWFISLSTYIGINNRYFLRVNLKNVFSEIQVLLLHFLSSYCNAVISYQSRYKIFHFQNRYVTYVILYTNIKSIPVPHNYFFKVNSKINSFVDKRSKHPIDFRYPQIQLYSTRIIRWDRIHPTMRKTL